MSKKRHSKPSYNLSQFRGVILMILLVLAQGLDDFFPGIPARYMETLHILSGIAAVILMVMGFRRNPDGSPAILPWARGMGLGEGDRGPFGPFRHYSPPPPLPSPPPHPHSLAQEPKKDKSYDWEG